MRMKLKTYGHGNKLDISKFEQAININSIVPKGGLWASPIDSEFGWKEWCENEGFSDLGSVFEFEFEGNILIINSFDDTKKLPYITTPEGLLYPDFEATIKQGYDAIWLTFEGLIEDIAQAKFEDPNFHEWGCECVLILSAHGFITNT